MKLLSMPLTAVACMTLVACSSGDDDATGPGNGNNTDTNIDQWGIVGLDTEEEVEIFALFGQFATGLADESFREEIVPELGECEVKIEQADEDDDGDDDLDFEFSVDYDEVAAGDAITLTSPAGTYSTLTVPAGSDGIIYTNEEGSALAGPAPSGLVADIPGGAYPASANVSIPDVQTLEITTPAEDTNVTPDTVFTWNATNLPNAYLDIASSSTHASTGVTTTVECTVADNGQFSFPAETQLEMGTGFTGDSNDYSRTVYRIEKSGTTVLVLNNTTDI